MRENILKMGENFMDFERFENYAKEMGFSMRFLSKTLGKYPTYLKDVKCGKASLTLPQKEKMAETLGTTVEYLEGETDIKKKPAEPKPDETDNRLKMLKEFYLNISEDGKQRLIESAFAIFNEEQRK